jgi:hypothetical protein
MTVSVYMIYGSEGNRALIFVIVLGGANRSFTDQFNNSITDVALKGKSLEVVALKKVHEKLGQ